MPRRTQTTHIVIHTAADARRRDGAHVDTPPEDIIAWHTDPKPRGRGWRAVGYHWLVRKSGEVVALRNERDVGSHCRDGGMNRKAVGVCFSGHGGDDYNGVAGEPWTDAQREAGLQLVAEIARRYGVPVRNIIGHREAGAPKSCPGDRIDCQEVREALAERLGEARRPTLRRGDRGTAVGEAQRRLAQRGLYRGAVDDDFGRVTEAAVRALQSDHGLAADGVLGPKTWAVLAAGAGA